MFSSDRFRNEFSCFNSKTENRPFFYLDNAATTQIPDVVSQTVFDYEARGRSNVKRGIYDLAEAATAEYETSRKEVAAYLGIDDPNEIVFTSGTTAGINLLSISLGELFHPDDEIILSELEHHSNIIPWQFLSSRKGIQLKWLPVDQNGQINFDSLERLLNEKTRLVALTHGSNVSGAISDIAQFTSLIRSVNAMIVLDGAQQAPHGPMDLSELDIDFYCFSSHKTYGPNGVGALWGRMEILDRLPPAWGGGEMTLSVTTQNCESMPPPHRFEAGTPPIAQVIGMGKALSWFSKQDTAGSREHLDTLTQKMIQGLRDIDGEKNEIRVLGPPPDIKRLPIVSFVMKDIHSHDICQLMNDEFSVCLRGGDHCAQPLHHALGIDESVRASLAPYNDMKDIDRFLEGIEFCLKTLK